VRADRAGDLERLRQPVDHPRADVHPVHGDHRHLHGGRPVPHQLHRGVPEHPAHHRPGARVVHRGAAVHRVRPDRGDDQVITATEPLLDPPSWALLQRELFTVLDHGWRRFAGTFCGPDGRLRFTGPMTSRDGGDDFYEAFANWPQLYLLGGADDLLTAT